MSDSFADLWNSTAPSKPAQPSQPRTLGAVQPFPQQRRPQQDVFSMLAATSTTSSRSVTPSYVPSQVAPRAGTSVGATLPGSGRPVQKSSSSGGDAFGDLFSGSFPSSSNGTNLTIAEKAALAEKQRLGLHHKSQGQSSTAKQATGSTWDGLDALGNSTFGVTRAKSLSPVPPLTDDWNDLLAPNVTSLSTTPKSISTKDDDDWGLNEFVSKPAVKQPSPMPAQSQQSLWDLDEFRSSPGPVAIRVSPAPENGRTSTPGSFDFGDREDGLLEDKSGDEDDILGVLAKPAQSRPSSTNGQSRVRSTPSPQPPTSMPRSRPVSPPPHIVGQIVEMGFSPQQARVALASTDTGLDVQAALETLLASGAASGSRHPSPPARSHTRDHDGRREALGSDEEGVPSPRQRIPPRRDRQRDSSRRENTATTTEAQRNIQDQANELLAQASTIGLSMFNRANALWKESKEKVQKAYEERASSVASTSHTGPGAASSDTRPKWMQDAPEGAQGVWDEHSSPRGGFRDEQHDDVAPVRKPREQPRKQPSVAPRSSVQPTPVETETSRIRTGNLLDDDAPKAYVSPFRRKAPARSQVPPTETRPAPAAPASTVPPLIQRKCITASSSELAISAKHKSTGAEMFKLGRYAEAETAWSYSIAALPDAHLLLVPLYNNRALTRLKTGDHSGAIDDCTSALKIIGLGYHPAREAKVTKEDEGAGVDLADAYVKALRRRAEAYEGKEKWEAAKNDWEAISSTEWASKGRNEAIQAAGRCRRMLTVDNTTLANSSTPSAPAAKPKPRPRPKPAQARSTPPSEALNRVREANQAAEAEDQEKHALKDQIDAKLMAWKGGKEANIRALIASLDTVLWPELGLQKVGMHELVTPSQVKIRYTKAIAKLHPDKLNTRNTTLEQRMIANGVFGALNEAWNSFKP